LASHQRGVLVRNLFFIERVCEARVSLTVKDPADIIGFFAVLKTCDFSKISAKLTAIKKL
jgi:hypothetical protein